MSDLNRFISALSTRFGYPESGFDPAGEIFLPVGDLGITIRKQNDTSVELICPVGLSVDTDSEDTLKLLLLVNYLGEGSGAGRISIDPVVGDVVLCERLPLTGLAEADIAERLCLFAASAASMAEPGFADMLKPPFTLEAGAVNIRI